MKKQKRGGTLEKLEKERTLLSNERTLLSYVRTAFAALVFGFALIQFAPGSQPLLSVGYASIFTGIAFIAIGLLHYSIKKRKIQTNNP